jgi:hypothetical protein
MSDSKRPFAIDETGIAQRVRASASDDMQEPSPQHDALIMKAARRAARTIGRRHGRRSLAAIMYPTSIAASLLLGLLVGRSSWSSHEPALHLSIPAGLSVRGQSGSGGSPDRAQIPVEQADAAVWYRYIQELLFSGQVEVAERHLHRFRQLHPDFVYQP